MSLYSQLSGKVNLLTRSLAYVFLLLGLLGSLYLVIVIYTEKARLLRIAEKVEHLSQKTLVQIVGARESRLLFVAAVTALCLAAGVSTYLLSHRLFRIVQYLDDLRAHATAIIENLSSGVISIDRQGRICYLSPAAGKMFPVSQTLQRTPYQEYFQQYPTLVALIREGLEHPEHIRHRDLEFRKGMFCRINCSRFGPRGELGIILHLDDITELRILEEHMKQRDRLAGIGALSAGLAHEIKNPLSAITIHCQLLEEKLEEQGLGPGFLKYLKVIMSEINRLNRVVVNILRFARSPAPKSKKIVLSELLDSILEVVQPETNGLGIKVQRCHFNSQWQVLGDRDELQHLFFNITVNAIQAMKEGGQLTVSMSAEGAYLRVEIADTGPGIAPEHLERIFDPFFTTKEEGTGYGLAIAQKIVEEHHGLIEVSSTPQGTRFIISLPLHDKPTRSS